MRKKTEEINEQPSLYRTWVGHMPEVNVLNPTHIEVRCLFPVKTLAERTVSLCAPGSLELCLRV